MLGGLRREALGQYLEGFNMALVQVWLLYPEVDLSECGPFKEIMDCWLLDPDSEGSNDQDEALEGVQKSTREDIRTAR